MDTLPLTQFNMSMKIISSRDAQNAFGHFLDTAQREPVIVTRRNRPVGVMLSMDNPSAIFELADGMRQRIRDGVKAGLADSEAGRMHELTDDFIVDLKQELHERIKAKKKTWKTTT